VANFFPIHLAQDQISGIGEELVKAPHKPISSYIESFRNSLQEELQAQREFNLNLSISAPWGRWVYANGEQHIYQFRTEEAVREPSDSHVRLILAHATFSGILIAARGLTAQIAFENYLGEEIFRGQLCFESAHLLRSLLETLSRLEKENKNFNWPLAHYLFSPLSENKPSSLSLMEKLKEAQRLIVWGPAGTGKTYALAQIAKSLLQQGGSLLITGNTHRSVNNGFARLLQILKEEPKDQSEKLLEGGILRFGLLGREKDEISLMESHASPDYWMKKHHPSLWERRLTLSLKNKAAKDQWEVWQRNRRRKKHS